MFEASESNGINAMLAHEARTKDDNTFVRGIVESYTFLGFGVVETYANERISVRYGEFTFTNVEVMVIGVNGWGIKPVPAPNDRVLLFSTQVPVTDLKQFKASGTMPAYDQSGLKAIPITDSNTAQMLTVNKTKIELTGKNTFTLDDTGFVFQDANGNKVTTSSSGVVFEDKNKNKVTTSDSGVAFEDKNNNKITTSSSGIAVEDKSHNKYTSTSSGITIEDKGGCKIVSDGSSTVINGNLEIKKSAS